MILESKIGANNLEKLEGSKTLFADVTLLEKDEKLNLKLFIEGENTTAARCSYSHYDVFYKTNLTSNIVLIYRDRYNKTPLFNPFRKDKVEMIYNKLNNTLYTESDESNSKAFDLDGLNVVILRDYKKVIEQDINNRIIELVNNSIDNLNLSAAELSELESEEMDYNYKFETENLFIRNKEVNVNSYAKFEFDNVCYQMYKPRYKSCLIRFEDFTIIESIYNKDFYVDKIAKYIIENFKRCLYFIIIKNNKMLETLEQIKSDENLIITKNVAEVLRNEDVKTLNITYKRNGKEMTFKIEANPHISNGDNGHYISKYKICNKADQTKFESTFLKDGTPWGEDIYLLNIESITYGRKVLYKK